MPGSTQRPPDVTPRTAPAASLWRDERLLQVRPPLGATLLWAALILAAVLAAAEAFARSPAGARLVELRGVGSRHFQFEVKYDRLERLASAESVTCLLLGDSTLHQAINPSAVADGLRRQAGADVTCFNFGVRGLSQAVLAPVAEILVEEFRPDLLVVGVNVTGLQRRLAADDNDAILESPWVRQRLGDTNWEGWLLDHSLAYRAFDPFRNWMYLGYLDELLREIQRWRAMDPYGFLPPRQVVAAPLPDMTVPLNQAIARQLAGFQPSAENLAGLERTLDLRREGVQVVLVETPVHQGFLTLLENGKADYDRGLEAVAEVARSRGAVFIPSSEIGPTIPLEGWANLNHMNGTGAELFSAWLTERLAALYQKGRLTPPGGAG